MDRDSSVIKILKRAAELRLSDNTINYNDEFIVAPQVPEGQSSWAKWVRNKVLQSFHVIWAFEDKETKQWLAVRVQIPYKDFRFSENPEVNTFYFNLACPEDQIRLRNLEEEFTSYCENSNA
jgi:hypothetical protein